MTLADYLAFRGPGPRWCPMNTVSPVALTPGSKVRVWWQCGKGHRWQAAVHSVTAGSGCPYCAGKRPIPGETDLKSTHPGIAALWHPKNKATAEHFMAGTHKKVWWKCEKGHEWEYQAVVFARTREKASGCPYCAGKKVLAGFNDLGTLRPKLAKEWYQSLNGKLTPSDVTLGSNKKVWWQCSDGHVWQAAIYSRTRKKAAGCPVCAGVMKQPQKQNPNRPRRLSREDISLSTRNA